MRSIVLLGFAVIVLTIAGTEVFGKLGAHEDGLIALYGKVRHESEITNREGRVAGRELYCLQGEWTIIAFLPNISPSEHAICNRITYRKNGGWTEVDFLKWIDANPFAPHTWEEQKSRNPKRERKWMLDTGTTLKGEAVWTPERGLTFTPPKQDTPTFRSNRAEKTPKPD